jgi:enediyne biosynthesis protein E4
VGSIRCPRVMSGIGVITLLRSGWGVAFLDYDNDGLKDLLIAQGHDLDTIELTSAQVHYREPMLLTRNTGKGFVDVSAQSGAVFTSRGLPAEGPSGILTTTGRFDAVVTTNGGPAHILRNETSGAGYWLTLTLNGHRSNRDAIGAEIKLTTPHGSRFVTVTTSGGYLSANDRRAHFGLGSDIIANTIDIRWPGGILQHLDNVKADQFLQVDEPSRFAAAPAHKFSFAQCSLPHFHSAERLGSTCPNRKPECLRSSPAFLHLMRARTTEQ